MSSILAVRGGSRQAVQAGQAFRDKRFSWSRQNFRTRQHLSCRSLFDTLLRALDRTCHGASSEHGFEYQARALSSDSDIVCALGGSMEGCWFYTTLNCNVN